MKKLTIYLCAGILAFGLTACGKGAQEDNDSQGTEQTDASDNLQESEGNSPEGSQDTSLETSGMDDGQQETDGSSGDDGQQEADGIPGGDDALEGWSQEMEGLRAAAVEVLGDDYWPDMALDSEMLEMKFGISPDMYEDFMGEIPMMSAHVDTLVIVKAKEDQLDAVRDALEAYRDAQINDTLQYPMNLGKIQASKVETVGSYVIFVMLGGDDTEALDNGEEAQIAFCQERNDLVINAIKGELGQ